ncbi:hypothetical protein CLV71_104383 [Actinophytocola oryzae]|uniref:Uncharacterized protein n=1 Tax=Actinophytocola oryzae TaxID=502181 RepID=A0A4R7VW92_9PSEU|nr:hypothetical protein CLV71_104383 [Actinophytocola oryzae]
MRSLGFITRGLTQFHRTVTCEYAVVVLTVRGDRLARIAVFADPAVITRFTQ